MNIKINNDVCKFKNVRKSFVTGMMLTGKSDCKWSIRSVGTRGRNYCNMGSEVYCYLAEVTVINVGDTGIMAARCKNLVLAEEVRCTAGFK